MLFVWLMLGLDFLYSDLAFWGYIYNSMPVPQLMWEQHSQIPSWNVEFDFDIIPFIGMEMSFPQELWKWYSFVNGIPISFEGMLSVEVICQVAFQHTIWE